MLADASSLELAEAARTLLASLLLVEDIERDSLRIHHENSVSRVSGAVAVK